MIEPNRYRLGVDQIRKYLPHRQPFLLVDRILEIHPTGDLSDPTGGPSKVGIRVVGLKNISYGESCFSGHFPEFSIFPGVWVIESMAQVACFSLYPYLEKDLSKLSRDFECILAGVDATRFRRPVVPGDSLVIESVVTKCRGKIWGFDCIARVDGVVVAEAALLANLVYKGEVR